MPNMETPGGERRPQATEAGPKGAPGPDAQKPRRSRGAIVTVIVLLVLLGLGWFVFKHKRSGQASGRGPQAGRGPGGLVPVPVVAGTVAQKDVPIYLDGLGTVQAFNTVTVRARVD